MDAPTAETLAWAARAVDPDAAVRRVLPLRGGITAGMDRIVVGAPIGELDVVLRRWPDASWADGLVEREVAALDTVAGAPVPTPLLVAADPSGREAGVRCTLTTALPGEPCLAPLDLPGWLGQLARAQAAIHRVPGRVEVRWDGWYDEGALPPDRFGVRHRALEWIEDAGLRAAAREAAARPRDTERVFVHGDFQPFNVLGEHEMLTGVVDWPNAAVGLRGADVGHCRLNLAVLFDAAAAATYLAAYEAAAGVHLDRVADLRAVLCFDPTWQDFIPVQVAGRVPVDVAGMPGRVVEVVRAAVDALG